MSELGRWERWQDSHLLRAFQAGELEAGYALLERYSRLVYAAARRCGADVDTADDIFVEVWIRLQKGVAAYQHEGRFTAYLRAVTISTAIDLHRRGRRSVETESLEQSPGEDESGRAIVDAAVADVDVEATVMAAEEQWLLDQAMAALPPRFREPILLHFRAGLSHQEVAARLDLPVNTVSSRIHRGKDQLRRWMREHCRDLCDTREATVGT